MSFTSSVPLEARLVLHWSPRSPFVRKVMIVLHETGLLAEVDCLRSVVGMSQPNETVMQDNPLNKIPTLLLPDGTALFDSRVICEYLDGLHDGERLLPRERDAYFQALTWQALGDGFLDLLLLWRNWYLDRGLAYDQAEDPYLATFALKTQRILAALEAQADRLAATPFGLGHIAIGCALGQLDFRWSFLDWQARYPRLAQWYATFQQRPSVIATQIRDDQAPT